MMPFDWSFLGRIAVASVFIGAILWILSELLDSPPRDQSPEEEREPE